MQISNYILNDFSNQLVAKHKDIDPKLEMIACANRLCEIRDIGLSKIEELSLKLEISLSASYDDFCFLLYKFLGCVNRALTALFV